MDNVNQIMILGTIHSQHLSYPTYSLKILENIILNLKPDIVLAEIPADKFTKAYNNYVKTNKIVEYTILRYPEYSEVIFPLSLKNKFKIIPFSVWTQEMADKRDDILTEIKNNPERKEDWDKFIEASNLSENKFIEVNNSLDPAWIHTNEFDDIMELKLNVFNRLFNNDLKEGGWDNINNGHYKIIDSTLNYYKNEGVRILLMIGAGHKGWMKRKLSQRTDIKLIKQIFNFRASD